MKELTHEEWMENPTPRTMWVWDDDEEDKKQERVVYYINADVLSPVVVETLYQDIAQYQHCAEIAKTRRMTNKELSRWLRENPTRECKYGPDGTYSVFSYHSYVEHEASEEVTGNVLIRENDGEWREPLIEMEE